MPVEGNPQKIRLSSECAAGVDDEHVRCQRGQGLVRTSNEQCECNCHDLSPVTLVSFGYEHAPSDTDHVSIGDAVIVIDVRDHFSDPHAIPGLRKLDGYDHEVRQAVMATAGVEELVQAVIAMVYAYRAAPVPGPVKIAVGCTGGRHRSVAIVLEVWERLWRSDHRVSVGVLHRDVDKPILPRRTRKSA